MSNKQPFAPQPVTILIVDDDPDCRMLIRDAIEHGKLENPVFEATSGEEGLAFLRREGRFSDAPRPGLVYLDIEMTGIDGIETVTRIRSDDRFNDIPVVMMTGVKDDVQKRRAMAAGANSYTNKPTDPETFLQTVLHSTHYWLCIHQYPSTGEHGHFSRGSETPMKDGTTTAVAETA